jgi:ABC-type sulfate transport system permease subunit
VRAINTINLVTKLLIFIIFFSFNAYICFYAKDKTEGIVTACIGILLVILVVTIGFLLEKKQG